MRGSGIRTETSDEEGYEVPCSRTNALDNMQANCDAEDDSEDDSCGQTGMVAVEDEVVRVVQSGMSV